MGQIRVDLYSDTITRPSAGMRKAMAEAPVGDEQKREDPTTNELQIRVAELLGKEAAVFLPSGTMCNQIAYRVHCKPGDEIILDESYHGFNFEGAGAAALSGAGMYLLRGKNGIFTPADVEAAYRQPHVMHHPRSRLLALEQTTNMGGGAIWTLDQINAVCAVARKYGLSTHLDGARLMNAVVESGVSAAQFAEPFDSLWLDFSKGLGAPIGGVLAGSKEFIAEAWRVKHQVGGALRQSGIITAACLYALDHNVDRLAEDHENARRLADGIAGCGGIRVEPVHTNMVFFDLDEANLDGPEFMRRIEAHGVRVSSGRRPNRLRAIPHLDISREDIDYAIDVIRKVAEGKL